MKRIDLETIEKLTRTSTATVATLLFKRGLRNAALRDLLPLSPHGGVMVGEAFTVRTIPSREDLDALTSFDGRERLHTKGFDDCPAGHVLVVDCRGDRLAAFGGGVLISRLGVRGAAGMVSDGAVRDSAEVLAAGIPVFAAGIAPAPSHARHHAADLNVPIGCAGVAVYPGDVVVGDRDGVVIVPREMAAEIADAALEQERYDAFAMEQIEAGRAIFGLYPPDEATKTRYGEWLTRQSRRSGKAPGKKGKPHRHGG
jgi:regulator of RNase E activity RraA